MAKEIKTARGRKIASTLWLKRQINDQYVERAKKEGYRSRAAYKLLEIDDKHHLLQPGLKVLDLGSAPGGWSQVAAARCGSPAKISANSIGGQQTASASRQWRADQNNNKMACLRQDSSAHRGGQMAEAGARDKDKLFTDNSEANLVFSIDLLDMPPIPGVTFFQGDFSDDATWDKIKEMAGGKVDIVLSDMAPNTTGHKETDHLRIMGLCEEVIVLAHDILNIGGHLLCKFFQGGRQKELEAELRKSFDKVLFIKPPASRSGSSETYLLALRYMGR